MTYPVFGPVHRFGLHVLRDWFSGVEHDGRPITVGSRIPADMSEAIPFVMVRADRRSGSYTRQSGDERFLRASLLSVETFTTGVNAENDGYDLQESARLALWQAWDSQIEVPGVGSISRILNSSEAALVSDFATSTGVVQYASLPKNAARTEAIYQLFMRPPSHQQTIENPFIPSQYFRS